MSTVLRWGSGLGLKIPARVARATGLEAGSAVKISLERGRIVIEPLPAVLTLERLLAGVTIRNQRHDFSWRPVDEEPWPKRGWG